MRFQGQSTASTIPPSPAMRVTADMLHSSVVKEDSGDVGELVPPGSPTAEIQLHTLLISWSGVDVPGEINITGANYAEVLSLDQTGASGNIPLAFDPPFKIPIGDYGLHITNDASGGRYNVTAYYSTVRS